MRIFTVEQAATKSATLFQICQIFAKFEWYSLNTHIIPNN